MGNLYQHQHLQHQIPQIKTTQYHQLTIPQTKRNERNLQQNLATLIIPKIIKTKTVTKECLIKIIDEDVSDARLVKLALVEIVKIVFTVKT